LKPRSPGGSPSYFIVAAKTYARWAAGSRLSGNFALRRSSLNATGVPSRDGLCIEHNGILGRGCTLAKLIDLLRTSMEAGGSAEVPLAEELDFVGRYLDLQKVRFGDRLRSHIDVADPDLLGARVPPLLLQPLVENSIVHGIRKCSGDFEIAVRAFRDDRALRLEVRDSGPGCTSAAPFSSGSIGVPNTRARLEHLYHDANALSFRRDGAEFVAGIRIPLRLA